MTIYKEDLLVQFVTALESVISQTLYPEEIILIADGPISSAIEEEIYKAQESHNIINLYKIDKNVGLGIALNYGLSKINNELLDIINNMIGMLLASLAINFIIESILTI